MSSKYWQWYHLQLAFIEKGHNPNNFEETFYIHSKPKQTLFSNDNIYKYLSWPKINCRPFFWSSIPHFFLVRFRKILRKETFIQKKLKKNKKKKRIKQNETKKEKMKQILKKSPILYAPVTDIKRWLWSEHWFDFRNLQTKLFGISTNNGKLSVFDMFKKIFFIPF